MTEQDVIFSKEKDSAAESASKSEQQKKSGSSGPEKRFKSGSVILSVWPENENGFRNYDLQRVYTTDDGDTWDYTNSFRLQDLKDIQVVTRKAYEKYGLEVSGRGGQ